MHRFVRPTLLASFAGLCVAIAIPAHAQRPASDEAAKDAVRSAAKRYQDAKRRGDVEAMRRMWTAEGTYIDAAGEIVRPRDSIDQTLPDESAGSLRMVAPNVAIEDGRFDMGDDGGEPAGRFIAVWVQRDGQWLLDSLREFAATGNSKADRLQSLEWLLGEWTATIDDAVVLVSSHWSDGGRYIVRDFAIRGEGDAATTATQRIGWDPIARKIKSWTFDSQGGSGEGYWRKEGDRWVVDSTEVTADGTIAKVASIYTPLGDDGFVWEFERSQVADTALPAGKIKFTRAPQDK